jgi:AraC-like DNA-binding protein
VAYLDPIRHGLDIVASDTEFAREYMSPRHFLGPQRLDFHQILLFTQGTGVHSVDLVRYPVSRGTLITVRPGQVQEWDAERWPSAKMLLFLPMLLLPDRPEYRDSPTTYAARDLPVRLHLTVPEFIMVEDGMDEIRGEIERSDGSGLSKELLSHLLHTLLLRLERIAQTAPTTEEAQADGPAGVCRRFRLEVEHHFKASRSVTEYAAALGYSEKGLYRAVKTGLGLTPKEVIDERVCLEARRLLVHTRWSQKRIAAELGFSEPTNFVKFFKRISGQTPGEYRREQLDGRPAPASARP